MIKNNDAVKALKICSKSCNHTCPYYEYDNCEKRLKDGILEVVERLTAENERLYKEVDRLSQCVLYHGGDIADAQKDALDEFIETLKCKFPNGYGAFNAFDVIEIVDETYKEMVGGD